MKQIIILIVLLIIGNYQTSAQLNQAMSFNIRYDNKADNENNWHYRKVKVVDLIRFYAPDVIGIQEGLVHQLNYMDSCLADYSYVGVGRDDGKRVGEYSAIFYDITKLKVIENNTFWLSETPEKVSFGWDAACRRVCTYALFKNIVNQRKVWVFNTHFDHLGKLAQAQTMQLIAKKIKEITTGNNFPVILMGDFNITPDNVAIGTISKLLSDAKELSKTKHYGPVGTFNAFKPELETKLRIDYIFVKGILVNRHVHIDDRLNNNRCVSDHYPVMIELEDLKQD